LAAGDSLTLIIEVNVNPVAVRPPGPNCAGVNHPDDESPDNNKSCVETVLMPPPEATPTPTSIPTATPTPTPTPTPTDLALQKNANLPFNYDQATSYTILIQNVGSATAQSPIEMVDDLPNGLIYVSYSSPYSPDWSCTASGQTVKCTYSGPDVAPGGFLPTLIINVSIASVDQFPAGSDTVRNCAELRYTNDVNPANDTSCVTTTITTP